MLELSRSVVQSLSEGSSLTALLVEFGFVSNFSQFDGVARFNG
jgi:hypothetical protein